RCHWACQPDRFAHSQAAKTTTAPINQANPGVASPKIPQTTKGARISAVMTRCLSTLNLRLQLFIRLPKAPLADTIGFQCLLHFLVFEVRPEYIGKIEFRISELP